MKEIYGRIYLGLIFGLLVQAAVEMGIAASRRPVPLPVGPAAAQGVSRGGQTTNKASGATCGTPACNQQQPQLIKK
jgi:hypothetical protein